MVRLRSSLHLIVVAVLVVVSSLACNALGGLANGTDPTATPRPTRTPASVVTEVPEPTEEEEPTEEPTEEEPTEEEPTEEPTEEVFDGVLFEDDFSDSSSGFGEDEDETARRGYRDGEYVIEILDTGWLIWNTAGQEGLSNTHTTVTITNVGEAQDPAFGVICNYESSDAFYYLGAGPDGYYAIVRSEGDNDVFLTSDENKWVQSDDIEQFADEYVLEAICASDGTLTLIINGVEIASVQDDTLTEGDVGLFAVSFQETPVEVHFDDLSVVDAQ